MTPECAAGVIQRAWRHHVYLTCMAACLPPEEADMWPERPCDYDGIIRDYNDR
jgi:hypothetical protein